MKHLVVITAEELKDAALHLMLSKSQFWGKHVSAVEFVWDPSDPVESRRIRCEVVLFDTEQGAKRYLESDGKDAAGDVVHDAVLAAGLTEEPAGIPADGNREREKK